MLGGVMRPRVVLLLLWIGHSTHAQDANCDYSQNVNPGQTYYISSPRYPNNYTGGVQCRWIAICPSGYKCRLDCNDINLPSSQQCSLDRLLISKSGDPQLTSADYYCGRGSVSALSDGQRISVGLITSRSSPGGRFMCSLVAQADSAPPQCSCGYKRRNRIVGGEETRANEFPMMAGLVYVSESQIRCGAVIIETRYVLSAAHCVVRKSTNDVAVIVGEHDVTTGSDSSVTQAFRVASFIIHPQFQESTYDYDIAIVVVNGQIRFSDLVGPVCLPFKFVNYNFTRQYLTLLGWGTTSFGGATSDVLRKVDVGVISQDSCRRQVNTLTSRQLCTLTEGKDACQDDSGGPALFTDPATGLLFNVGVISYGRSCAEGFPGINTRVTVLLDWIVSNAPGNYCMK